VEHEERKLQELESVLFKDFRREFIERIRKQGMKVRVAANIKTVIK